MLLLHKSLLALGLAVFPDWVRVVSDKEELDAPLIDPPQFPTEGFLLLFVAIANPTRLRSTM